MSVSVEHPTDRPNFYIVHGSGQSVAFSYRTIIGVNNRNGSGWFVRVNEWGPTTGKHMNYLDDGRKSERVDGATLQGMVTL